jgi:hypothetical protein
LSTNKQISLTQPRRLRQPSDGAGGAGEAVGRRVLRVVRDAPQVDRLEAARVAQLASPLLEVAEDAHVVGEP